MDKETDVEPQETVLDVVEQVVQEQVEQEVEQPVEQESKTHVPLSALQKERKKRQELELELKWERDRQKQSHAPKEDDSSRYESATKEDLALSQTEAVRIIEEKMWAKNNPEKLEKVNELLPEFLKQRPNLALAINSASNRYEEAYILMEALTPKQQQQLKATASPKKEAPGSPTNVPKGAALSHAVDVMNMSDNEFHSWRKSQKRR